jgi:hypothetical protein
MTLSAAFDKPGERVWRRILSHSRGLVIDDGKGTHAYICNFLELVILAAVAKPPTSY